MISPEQIDAVGRFAQAGTISEGLVGTLREQFPGIHFTYCMVDDVMAGAPAFEATAFNLYLVDSSNHCLAFTQDPQIATGIVVAELEDE